MIINPEEKNKLINNLKQVSDIIANILSRIGEDKTIDDESKEVKEFLELFLVVSNVLDAIIDSGLIDNIGAESDDLVQSVTCMLKWYNKGGL